MWSIGASMRSYVSFWVFEFLILCWNRGHIGFGTQKGIWKFFWQPTTILWLVSQACQTGTRYLKEAHTSSTRLGFSSNPSTLDLTLRRRSRLGSLCGFGFHGCLWNFGGRIFFIRYHFCLGNRLGRPHKPKIER